MMRALIGSLLILSACATAPNSLADADRDKGSLVIAGGGLERSTASVWQAFISSARETGPFVIVPSASGSPAQSAASVAATLAQYGVAPDRIEIAKLAVLDDRSTERVNEATWARNIDDPATIDLLTGAAAIWFTGGDQSRTTALFLSAEGKSTSALQGVETARAAGAPIGGTSAGAAIMSDPMITQGDTLTALAGSSDGEALGLGAGLGFFEFGLVDQHFGERARLGRLVAALGKLPDPENRIGFGIDEDTAFIVEQDSWSVAGSGYVTVIDARGASYTTIESGAFQVTGLTLHLLSSGDRLSASTLSLMPADWKSATVGDEYLAEALPGGGGMALPGQTLQAVLGEGLIDNAEATTVERISFNNTGQGVAYVFTQLPQSAGYWGRDATGSARYAIANIRFDILPIQVSVETLK